MITEWLGDGLGRGKLLANDSMAFTLGKATDAWKQKHVYLEEAVQVQCALHHILY